MYPNLSSNNQAESTKDQILNVLSYDWPLSIKKIYFLLKKRYSKKLTYQAVYKAINQMRDSNILIKTKLGYQLNLKYIKEIHNQTEIIRVNYFSEQHAALFDKSDKEESIRVFIFKTWFDVEKYLYYLQKSVILNSKEKQIICVHHNHEWRPIFYLRAEYNWINDLYKKGHKVFTLCSGNSAIDKWSSKFYNNLKSKIKLGVKCVETSEILVFSDLVIQTYIPLELKEKLHEIFKKTKEVKDLNHLKLIKEVFEKQAEIKVVINKDKVLASQIKKQTLSKFK